FAQQVRREIRKRIDDGQTNEQINEFLVGRFGEDIDLTPRATGLVGLVWILPVAFAVVGVFGLAAYFQRNRAVQPTLASASDRKLVEQARAQAIDKVGESGRDD
ncbi:MAG: cytochrome c-type biogenesis protein CcmH, partial [Acidimicrobiales bacterium]